MFSEEERIKILHEKRDKVNSISKSFCAAKWLQVTIHLQNGFNHSCHHPQTHQAPLSELKNNPGALHNTSYKKKLRKQMLDGERPGECDYCWRIEDLGKDHLSDRYYKSADSWAWDKIDEIASLPWDADVYPTYLEVSFSNVCNFKCAYCMPEISSKWLEEIKQHGPYKLQSLTHSIEGLKQSKKYPYKHSEYNPYVDAFWKWFPEAYKHLKVFRITGGEPLLSKDTWKVLEHIKLNPKKDFEIAINTNLCVEDKLIDKLIAYLNDVKDIVKVMVYTSLESTGAQAEYSRYGLDYEKWKSNMDKLLSQTDTRIVIMTTVNILSLPTTVNFIDLIMGYREKYNHSGALNRIPFSFNFLRWPQYLDIRILPHEMKKKYYNEIIECADRYRDKPGKLQLYIEEYHQLKRLCDYMLSDADNLELNLSDFSEFIKQYDQRRFLKFDDVFPEYSFLINK